MTNKKPPEFIDVEGQPYQYSPADGAYYPVPTRTEYDFQRFVVFISAILLVAYIAYIIIEKQ